MTRPAFDLGVYLVTDRPALRGRELVEVVAEVGRMKLEMMLKKHIKTF